jgi:hypothetical protein
MGIFKHEIEKKSLIFGIQIERPGYENMVNPPLLTATYTADFKQTCYFLKTNLENVFKFHLF